MTRNTQNPADKYKEHLKSRYKTLKWTFDEFVRIGGKTVVELGTTRSFVGGGNPGCMVNDEQYWRPDDPAFWDWGAGMFTRVCAEFLVGRHAVLHTVDISEKAIAISKITTAPYRSAIRIYIESSECFLNRFLHQIDLLYMDAGETQSAADRLHLREAEIVVERELVSNGGIVLIDDVNIPGSSHSKGRYSIPFLLAHGFEVKVSDYQVVLQRRAASGTAQTGMAQLIV